MTLRTLSGPVLASLVVLTACNRPEAPPELAEDGVSGTRPTSPGKGPLTGEIHGRPFHAEEATIEAGILTLVQGEEFRPDLGVVLFLFLDEPHQPPEGRRFAVDCEGPHAAGGAPHLHVKWKPEGADSTEVEMASCDYSLDLQFGTEGPPGRLPGTVHLSSERYQVEITGSFVADIEGFRLVDGEPDLQQDGHQLLRVVAARFLEEQLGHPVNLAAVSGAWSHAEPTRSGEQAGFGVYWWARTTEAEREPPWEQTWSSEAGPHEGFAKLRFSKGEDGWAVKDRLEPWQLPTAHPLVERSDLGGALSRRAAAAAEQAHREAKGTAPWFEAKVQTTYNPSSGIAVTKVITLEDESLAREVSGFFGGDEGRLTRYLFRKEGADAKDPAAWTLIGPLADGETVDRQTGEIRRD